ncbi:MAG: OsmC family protein [Kiritimatiellae bacterium]|nr:OsmC family protein [Kiritimatiellia bacterium]
MNSEIKVTFPGGKKVDAEIKGMMVHTDQAVEDGGEGTAPAPFDYFLVSLATCSGIVAAAYCRRKGISTEGLTVSMDAPWDDARNRCDQVTFHLTLPKDFPEDHIEPIRQRVEACAVKKHILQPPEFRTVIQPFKP